MGASARKTFKGGEAEGDERLHTSRSRNAAGKPFDVSMLGATATAENLTNEFPIIFTPHSCWSSTFENLAKLGDADRKTG